MVLDGVAEADSEEMSSQWSFCLVNAVSENRPTARNCGLEHAAELEEPFAVTGVADAAADEEGAERGFGQEACGNVIGEVAAGSPAIHFSDVVGSAAINLLAQKGRKDQQVTQKSRAQ